MSESLRIIPADYSVSALVRDVGAASRLIAPQAKVLIVDDINVNLKAAEGLLQGYGISIDLCGSGAEAVETVKKVKYDLVFMDHMMPEMDGIEATAEIRALGGKDPYYASLPIIALTANAVPGSEEMFLENGFTDFLSKPIDIMELDMLLKKWLPKNKQVDADGGNEPRRKATKHDEVFNVSIKGVNSEKGIRETGGTIRNYMKMLAVFYDEGTKKLSDIKASLESKNISLYTTCVHGLKSSLSIIGAEKLSHDAKKLESAGKQGDFNYIQDHNSGFLMNLKSLLESINEVISKDAPDTGGAAPDADFLIRTLTEFKEALENFDSAGIGKAVDILQEYTRLPDIGDTVQNILNNRLIGEHEAAADGIEALINSL